MSIAVQNGKIQNNGTDGPLAETRPTHLAYAEYPDLPFKDATTIAEDAQPSENYDSEMRDKPMLPAAAKFVHINVNRLKTRYTDVRKLLVTEKNIVACGISETRTRPEDYKGIFVIPNYKFFVNERKSKLGGGVGIYVHESYYTEEIEYEDSGSVELIIIKISKNNVKPIIFVTAYVPPNKINDDIFVNIENLLAVSIKANHEIVLYGVFNIDLGVRTENTRKLLNVIREYGMT